ncbi:hypothetical protein [Idiomarina ramblicola]|uniref:Uncharacterized protein n=1 Tax=Idiomarina ramblicola TaxID=263724 RepID=A0A432YSV1_9GAMM|nr:hypothetical protein [Idiomarina ramblicola]RUO64775.1 hypothetical protein CWI78_11415 [Idiomarina ramblicola]
MRWKLITITCLLAATLNPGAIRTINAATYDNSTPSPTSDLKQTYRNIIDNHLHKNFSIMRTVRILINHYPEHATYIVNAAFDVRESRIKAIVVAAMQAEPAVTYNVIDVALARFPHLTETLVEAAIQTEPAYIDDIITVALKHQPDTANAIIRQAVVSHPDFTESVLRTTAKEAPNFMLSSIIESIKALPDAATSLVAVLKDFFVGAEDKKTPYKITKEDWNLLILEAKQSGVSREELEWLVKEGYVEQEAFAQAFDNKAVY